MLNIFFVWYAKSLQGFLNHSIRIRKQRLRDAGDLPKSVLVPGPEPKSMALMPMSFFSRIGAWQGKEEKGRNGNGKKGKERD